MEVAYFVTHPSLKLTAIVYAPSTEKARTTFLDWLERNGHIKRVDRHMFRKNLVAHRTDDINIPTDAILHYGYRDMGTYSIPQVPEPEPVPAPVVSQEIPVEEPQQVPIQIPIQPEEPQPKLMPIQQVALKGFVE